MKSNKKDLRLEHKRVVELLEKGVSFDEIATSLKLPKVLVKKWLKGFKRMKDFNLKKKFINDFSSGKYSVDELARLYNEDRRKLLKWKHEVYGKGSLKQRLMYKMHIVGIPPRFIAEFYNVSIPQVHKSIRNEKTIVESK